MRVGLFHGNVVKPELLIGVFLNVAHVLILVKSDGRAPAVPSLSLTIRSLCPPVLCQAVLQLCTRLARVLLQGGQLGFQSLQVSEFPHLLWE